MDLLRATAEGKDPKRELHNYLLQYRATPRTTLGKSPAGVLFGRKIQTKLPQYHPVSHTKESKGMHTHHNNKKLLQKVLSDKRHKAQTKPVYVGDKVLLTQEKSTTKQPFDPHPYNVIKVKGSQLTGQRQGQVWVRDKNYIKVLQPRPPHLAPSWQKLVNPTITRYSDFNIEGVITGSISSGTPPSLPKQSSPSSATPCPLEQSLDSPVSPAEPDDSLHPLPIPHHEVLEAQQEQGLFQLEPDTVN